MREREPSQLRGVDDPVAGDTAGRSCGSGPNCEATPGEVVPLRALVGRVSRAV